jgi:hypothetical protein
MIQTRTMTTPSPTYVADPAGRPTTDNIKIFFIKLKYGHESQIRAQIQDGPSGIIDSETFITLREK